MRKRKQGLKGNMEIFHFRGFNMEKDLVKIGVVMERIIREIMNEIT